MDQKDKSLLAVYEAIFVYKNKSKADRESYIQIFKNEVVNNIKHLLVNTGTKKSLNLNADTVREIDEYADELVKNVKENYSRSFFRKWTEKIIRFITRKNQSVYKENIALKTLQITDKLTQLIENDPQNKEALKRDKLLRNAEFYLEKISHFDLLDKLTNFEEIKKLNDKDLNILYRLSVLDISINGIEPGEALSIGDIQTKITKAEKENRSISRNEMLSDIDFILKDFAQYTKSPINIEHINEIKYGKSSMLVLDFEKDIGSAYKKDPELLKIYQEVVDKSDMYFLKEIAFDVSSKIAKSGKSTLFDTYIMVNNKSAHSALTNDILLQLKEQKSFILDKLKYADDVESFKDKLVKKLQGKSITNHVELVMLEIDPDFKHKSENIRANKVASNKSIRIL